MRNHDRCVTLAFFVSRNMLKQTFREPVCPIRKHHASQCVAMHWSRCHWLDAMYLCIVDQVREASLSLDVTAKDEYTFLWDPGRHYGITGTCISLWTDEHSSNIFPLEEGSGLHCR